MENSEKLKLILPYEDKKVMATVQNASDKQQLRFFIEFTNGYRNIFYTRRREFDLFKDENYYPEQWKEETLGVTSLSVEIGMEIENYLEMASDYEEPFIIKAISQEYIVQPVTGNGKISFMIYEEGEFLFTIQLNEDGAWENASSKEKTEMIQIIGEQIEQIFS